MRKIIWSLTLTLLLTEVSFSQTERFTDLVQIFDYDPTAALDIKENGVEELGGVKVRDISYVSPKGGRVTAYLVVPPGKGPFAAIEFLHTGQGDRSTFLAEALLLAKAGAVSLLIDAPFARPSPWRGPDEGHFTQPEIDRDMYVQTVVDLRRGIDLLTSRQEVDVKRIAYIGHSYGATWGGVLAGVEKRIKAFVLMAGLPSITDFSGDDAFAVEVKKAFTPKQIENYIHMIGPLNAINYVSHAAPSGLFFQFARQDKFISEKAALEYEQASSEPKRVKWYYGGHELNDIEALRDRAEWLRTQIKIAPLISALGGI